MHHSLLPLHCATPAGLQPCYDTLAVFCLFNYLFQPGLWWEKKWTNCQKIHCCVNQTSMSAAATEANIVCVYWVWPCVSALHQDFIGLKKWYTFMMFSCLQGLLIWYMLLVHTSCACVFVPWWVPACEDPPVYCILNKWFTVISGNNKDFGRVSIRLCDYESGQRPKMSVREREREKMALK